MPKAAIAPVATGRNQPPTEIDPMMRLPAVSVEVGLSRSTIWRRIRDGSFPPPRQIGKNSIGWPTSTIKTYKDNLPAVPYAPSQEPGPDTAIV